MKRKVILLLLKSILPPFLYFSDFTGEYTGPSHALLGWGGPGSVQEELGAGSQCQSRTRLGFLDCSPRAPALHSRASPCGPGWCNILHRSHLLSCQVWGRLALGLFIIQPQRGMAVVSILVALQGWRSLSELRILFWENPWPARCWPPCTAFAFWSRLKGSTRCTGCHYVDSVLYTVGIFLHCFSPPAK